MLSALQLERRTILVWLDSVDPHWEWTCDSRLTWENSTNTWHLSLSSLGKGFSVLPWQTGQKMPEITQQKIKAHLWIAIVSKPFFATLHHSIYAAYTASIPLYKHIQTITTCIQSRIYTNHQRCTKMIRKLKQTIRESNHMRIGLLDPTICLLRSRWSQILATAPMHHKIKRKENTSAEDST